MVYLKWIELYLRKKLMTIRSITFAQPERVEAVAT
jgi:hypothetical protein